VLLAVNVDHVKATPETYENGNRLLIKSGSVVNWFNEAGEGITKKPANLHNPFGRNVLVMDMISLVSIGRLVSHIFAIVVVDSPPAVKALVISTVLLEVKAKVVLVPEYQISPGVGEATICRI